VGAMNIVFAVLNVVLLPWHCCSSDNDDIVGHCCYCGDVIVMIILK